MTATRTPGKLYIVRRLFGALRVIQVDREQGERMRERGEKHVYGSSAQAQAVRDRLERGRG